MLLKLANEKLQITRMHAYISYGEDPFRTDLPVVIKKV